MATCRVMSGPQTPRCAIALCALVALLGGAVAQARGVRGTIGLKTGSTDEAGHCLVAIVRRGHRELGVVLLHSPNTGLQARQLFDAAFRAGRA